MSQGRLAFSARTPDRQKLLRSLRVVWHDTLMLFAEHGRIIDIVKGDEN